MHFCLTLTLKSMTLKVTLFVTHVSFVTTDIYVIYRSFVSNLPDKGEKIKNFREQLVAEINNYSVNKKLNENSVSLDIVKKPSINITRYNEHAIDVSTIDSKPDAVKKKVLKKLFACSKVHQNFKKVIVFFCYQLLISVKSVNNSSQASS